MTVPTCNPPAELAHKQWHWLRHPEGDLWYCSEVRDGKLWLGPGWVGGETAYRGGWRYWGPAETPPERMEADTALIRLTQAVEAKANE